MTETRYMPLTFKPDLEDAARRWDAYYQGEMIDRPIVCVTAPRDGMTIPASVNYYDRVHADIDSVVDRALAVGDATYWGGEAVPAFMPSFGPDEVAVFCGAELEWSGDSGDTNWSKPLVTDWRTALPLRLNVEHPLWQRILRLYRRCAERMAGKMVVMPLDLHTNMDLLSALRSPQQLCLDLIECPDYIDQAMLDSRAIFPQVWRAIADAGKMDTQGYSHVLYSMQGAAFLQCDFAALIGPAMFKRWVLPALEEEAEIVKHVVYHWDGPSALVHADLLAHSRGLHTMSYVPGDGNGTHIDYLPLLQRMQAAGKAVHVWGTPDQMKALHHELKPNLVMYCTTADSQAEADALLKWFVNNT